VAVALVMAVAMPAMAQQASSKHTGTVVAIDLEQRRLVLDEIGPSRPGGVVQPTRRTIHLTASTEFIITLRANPQDGFPGQFIEGELDAEAIERGDLVTADCLHDGRRLIARTVTLLTPTAR
jgi:hypothetical protein